MWLFVVVGRKRRTGDGGASRDDERASWRKASVKFLTKLVSFKALKGPV